jgi:hypothetical protein
MEFFYPQISLGEFSLFGFWRFSFRSLLAFSMKFKSLRLGQSVAVYFPSSILCLGSLLEGVWFSSLRSSWDRLCPSHYENSDDFLVRFGLDYDRASFC